MVYMCAKCDFRTSNPHEMDNHSSIHKRKAEEPYDGLSQKSRRIAMDSGVMGHPKQINKPNKIIF